MKPIIRWAGSKRQLLPSLRRLTPDKFNRYVEPFCGSACFFFDLEPSSAILGDLNPELIMTYKALQRDASLVFECLQRIPKGVGNYYKIRAVDPDQLCDAEIAARFLYLNRYCFNGIYRTNKQGQFNVPYGSPKRNFHFDYDTILSAAKLLQGVILVNQDFEDTLKRVDSGDFVYIDPPYAVAKRKIFAEYHPAGFNTKDLKRLGHSLAQMHDRGITFLISYADSREARELLAPWDPRRVRTHRHIAGFAYDRRSAYELLATNTKELSNGL